MLVFFFKENVKSDYLECITASEQIHITSSATLADIPLERRAEGQVGTFHKARSQFGH